MEIPFPQFFWRCPKLLFLVEQLSSTFGSNELDSGLNPSLAEILAKSESVFPLGVAFYLNLGTYGGR